MFAISLVQVIENDKAAEKAHKSRLSNTASEEEQEIPNNSEEVNTVQDQVDSTTNIDQEHLNEFNEEECKPQEENKKLSQSVELLTTSRRLSEPNFELSRSISDQSMMGLDEPDNSRVLDFIRTIDCVKEEDEDETRSQKRKSRLIEALTLSSTSASSLCILDRETEFKPPKPQVPIIVQQTVDYINTYALNTVGIFRTGGSKKRVRQVRSFDI